MAQQPHRADQIISKLRRAAMERLLRRIRFSLGITGHDSVGFDECRATTGVRGGHT